MKVFIFGAGASQGSQDPTTPPHLKAPLTNELFNTYYLRYFDALGIKFKDLEYYIKHLQQGDTLEKLFTDRWNDITHYKSSSTKHSEKVSFGRLTFYIWKMLQAVSGTYNQNNLYAELIRKLVNNDDEFGFISFNYDTLLDRAVEDILGFTLGGSIENYTKNKLIKPHGSVNWVLTKRPYEHNMGYELTRDTAVRYQRASAQIYTGDQLNIANSVVFDPSHTDLDDKYFVAHDSFGKNYFYPLIFVPLLVKQYDHIANFYDRVISEGISLLSTADEIYIIGYKASDEIIKDLFSKVSHGTKINIIARNTAPNIANDILSWKPELKPEWIDNMSFKDFVAKLS